MTTLREGKAEDIPALVTIWRRSVEATHRFLTSADVDALQLQVADVLATLELWVVEVDGMPAGFLAMQQNMIEALFIDPAHTGKRLGTRFIEHARTLRGRNTELRVDVNEQNPDALGFYLAIGFTQVGRSPTDSAGRPWPLIHFAMNKKS